MNKFLIEMFLENKDVLNQASPVSIDKITPTSYLITYDTKSKFFKVIINSLKCFYSSKNDYLRLEIFLIKQFCLPKFYNCFKHNHDKHILQTGDLHIKFILTIKINQLSCQKITKTKYY